MRFGELLAKGITLTRESRKNLLLFSLAVGVLAFIFNSFGGLIIRGKQTTIVSAASDLSAGTILQKKDLKDITISGAAPPGILTSDNDAVGLALALPVKAGTPLVKNIVAKEPLRDGLYPGEVGMWIGVNLVSSGLVNPGDIVDVLPQLDPNHPMSIPSNTQFKGIRVVNVVNGSAQPTKGQTGGNSVPAAVELAIPSIMASNFAEVIAGKMILAPDPYATPLTPNAGTQNQSGVSGTVISQPAYNAGPTGVPKAPVQQVQPVQPVSPGAPSNSGTATVPSNNNGSAASVSTETQNNSPQVQPNTGNNDYVPPIFNPDTSSSQ